MDNVKVIDPIKIGDVKVLDLESKRIEKRKKSRQELKAIRLNNEIERRTKKRRKKNKIAKQSRKRNR